MFLISQGVSLDSARTQGRTGLDSFVGAVKLGDEEYRLLSRLIECGGVMTIDAASQSRISKENMRRVLRENEEVVIIPDVAKCIIEESEEGLLHVLRSGRASANDVIGKTTLLKLAIGWSKGVQILLVAGSDVDDCSHISPLTLAIRGGYYESAKILLQAGCPLSLVDISQSESASGWNETTSLLISELASRRRRLLKLAQAYLSQETLARIGVDNDSSVPDMTASRIYETLVAQDARIDSALQVSGPPRSVYHHLYLRTRTLDELYEAGFDNVELLDPSGRTPLMVMDKWSGLRRITQERARWLISKGADPFRQVPGTNATVLHLMGIYSAECLHPELVHSFLLNFQSFKSQNPLEFLKFMFQASEQDNCICACSPGRCTPFSAALRHLLQHPPRYYQMNGPNRFPELLHFVIRQSERSLEVDQVVIRLMTFDALDLRHTCCRKGDGLHDDSIVCVEETEVEEIRDEEHLLLEDYERLLAELSADFEKSGLLIMEFLQGHWYQRMVEFLSRLDPYDEEYARGHRSLGLKVEIRESIPDRVSLLVGSKVKETLH
ncbi:hypothetical protein N7474_011163 [Penicillium riverlandense]|uniref:uncharacterized protein n=1 Tax=Penicillium riverlandense TaxID=1903569 RepID=UPI00254953DE|nr:uncharacterized protein N7474_011163 [Penicillium riverlandense]KAJ5805276.1 hypothetical protein N7474_011163 [Penicillium riverlandense]